jgi:predicted nuclease of predicted toxin-antitoxin system
MRFKIDENLPPEAAVLLRDNGHDADTVLDEALGGSPDPTVAATCKAEQRILVTLDLDFADILQYPPLDYPGIIVLRPARQDRDTVMAIIPRILELLRTEIIAKRLWIMDDTKTRIRGES